MPASCHHCFPTACSGLEALTRKSPLMHGCMPPTNRCGKQTIKMGFPGGASGKEPSANSGKRPGLPQWLSGKESSCNAGAPGLIPGWERSPGGGHGNPLQHSWAPLIAQSVKESTCNAGDQGLILGQEDPLEKEMATHSSILA